MATTGITYGAIDAGGTSFRCLLATGPDHILEETAFPTTHPAETLGRAADFFRGRIGLAAIGVAAFGPLDLAAGSPTHGRVLTTPKPGWSGADMTGSIRDATGVPVRIDTDVNAAALAECAWGAGRDVDRLAYITVGTGVGLGLATRVGTARGLLHPEAGHILPPRSPGDEAFPGTCPFHGACVEGLASAGAMRARTGLEPHETPGTHPAWRHAGHALAHLVHAAILVASADRVVIGGGLAGQDQLTGHVRAILGGLFGDYDAPLSRRGGLERICMPAGLGTRAGALGGLWLAMHGRD
jgi:fructokinase